MHAQNSEFKVQFLTECVHAYIACLRSIESISNFPQAWHFWSKAVAQLSLVGLMAFHRHLNKKH